MNVILIIISIIVISYIFLIFTKMLKISSIVSLIIFGVLLGLPGLNEIYVDGHELIFILGDIGLFSLMFLAGLESSWRTLLKEEKDSLYIALFGAIIPFLLGFIIFKIMGFSFTESFIVGICMSITAEATKAKFLIEIKKLNTRLGSTMIGAGIIDDLFGLLMFSIIMFSVGIVDFKEHIILLGVLLSFFIGIFVRKYARHHHITKKIEKFLNIFIIPFFFVSMGVHFNIFSLLLSPSLLFIVISVAILGKIIGTLLTKSFLNFSYKQLYLIGWGMNSRGAIELALAIIALRANIIDQILYSTLVMMALITTIIFPLVAGRIIKNNPQIMN